MGKFIKNILIILIGFLIISQIFALLQPDIKSKEVKISDLVNLVDQEKVESLSITDNRVTAKVKDSDTAEYASIGPNTNIYEVLDRYGLAKEKIRKANIEERPASAWANFAATILPFLIPFALVTVVIYFFMRQVQGSNNRAMSFGQSAVKLSDERKNKMKFADVAGAKEAKEELKEIVEFLRMPSKVFVFGRENSQRRFAFRQPRAWVRPCWPAQWLAKLMYPSSIFPVQSLWKCLWA